MGKRYKNRKLKLPIIKGYLIAPLMFFLIALFWYVCVNSYPFWVVNVVLGLNILCLLIMIFFGELYCEDPRKRYKNRTRLLIWGVILSFSTIICILLRIFYNLEWPSLILLTVYMWLKYKYGVWHQQI